MKYSNPITESMKGESMTLTKEQAISLFRDNCLFIREEVMPMDRARKILGDEAVDFVKRQKGVSQRGNPWHNSYGTEAGSLDFLSLDGYLEGVAYYNATQYVMETEKQAKRESGFKRVK